MFNILVVNIRAHHCCYSLCLYRRLVMMCDSDQAEKDWSTDIRRVQHQFGQSRTCENTSQFGQSRTSENTCQFGQSRTSENTSQFGQSRTSENTSQFDQSRTSKNTSQFGQSHASEHTSQFGKSLLWPGASQWRIYYHRMWGQLSTTCSN